MLNNYILIYYFCSRVANQGHNNIFTAITQLSSLSRISLFQVFPVQSICFFCLGAWWCTWRSCSLGQCRFNWGAVSKMFAFKSIFYADSNKVCWRANDHILQMLQSPVWSQVARMIAIVRRIISRAFGFPQPFLFGYFKMKMWFSFLCFIILPHMFYLFYKL